MEALNTGDPAAWSSYLARMKRQLNALTNAPRLTRIDAFVRSLRLSPPRP
jgi:hypothetical protein